MSGKETAAELRMRADLACAVANETAPCQNEALAEYREAYLAEVKRSNDVLEKQAEALLAIARAIGRGELL